MRHSLLLLVLAAVGALAFSMPSAAIAEMGDLTGKKVVECPIQLISYCCYELDYSQFQVECIGTFYPLTLVVRDVGLDLPR